MIAGLYERINKTVTKEAQKAERRWNNFVDADDIEQELWMFIMTRPSVQEYLIGADILLAARALATQADSICSKERLAYDRFTGNWTYNPMEVRELLQKYLKNVNELPTEEKCDLEKALEYMKSNHPRYFSVLQKYHWVGEPFRTGAEKERLSQAHRTLADVMNAKRSTLVNQRTEGLGTASNNLDIVYDPDLDAWVPANTINQEDY